jgi:hypothetical protein
MTGSSKCSFQVARSRADEILGKAAERIILWHRPQNVPGVLWKA